MNNFPREFYEIVVSKNFKDDDIDVYLRKNSVLVVNTGDIDIGEQLFLALSNSSGDIVCFLDDDDRFKPNKLNSVFLKFSGNSDLVYYHNSADSIDDKSITMPGNIHKRIKDKVIIQGPSPDGIAKYLRSRDDFTLYSLMFNLSCVSIRRRIIEGFMEYLKKIIDGTDWFIFYCAMLSSGMMEFDTEILSDYRVHVSFSNVLTSQIPLKGIAKFTIEKFEVEGHFTLVLLNFCIGTGAEKILRAKILEEKILMRILGKRNQNIPLKDYVEYLRMLQFTAHPSIKNTLVRFIFISLSLFLPTITGIFYNLYRKHSLLSRLYNKTL